MQMRARSAGVSCIPHEADDIALLDTAAGSDQLPIEVRVIVRFRAQGTRDPDDVSAEAVGPD
jgi:hypothetical protein